MLFQTPKNSLRKSRNNHHKRKQRKIDKAIHQIVGIEYKNCSATWKVVKKKIIEDEEDFVNILKKSVKD